MNEIFVSVNKFFEFMKPVKVRFTMAASVIFSAQV